MNKSIKYVVLSLTIICGTTFVISCKKNQLNYTGRMAGNHKWVGNTYRFDPVSGITTSSADTFNQAIQIINEQTIVFADTQTGVSPTDTMKYIAEVDKTLVFVSSSPSYAINLIVNDTMKYNYTDNTIIYSGRSSNRYSTIHFKFQAQ